MNHTLYLASSSSSRKELLHDAKIPFSVITQTANEQECDYTLPLDQLVLAIARHKMAHAIVPDGTKEGDISFVLTADTLAQDLDGTIQGKAHDRADAIAKIKSCRDGARVCTAFYIEKRVWHAGRWELIRHVEKVVHATYRFVVPDDLIEYYCDNVPVMEVAGAVKVEGFGQQFLQVVNGSYAAIIGLPLYEVRQALTELGFFFSY